MEILFEKYSILLLDYKDRMDECEIVLVPGHLSLENLRAVYRGKIVFRLENKRLRPEKFYLDINRRLVPLPSKKFISALRLCKKIILPKNLSPPFRDDIFSMLSDFQVPADKIIEPELCSYCNFESRVTDLKDNYYMFLDRKLCFLCAKKEIIKELSFKGFKGTGRIANYLEKILLKIKDVKKVLNFLLSDNVVFDPELAKYDCVPADIITEEVKVDSMDIPDILKLSLKNRGIVYLLPSQSLAVRNGLLDDEDLLIVSATSGGKTLSGELAGIKKVYERKETFLFLVPLVALANQLYNDFKKRYEPFGIKVAIKVGMPHIEVGDEELVVIDDDIRNADVVIATYEGFDVALRSDINSCPKKVGTIVIDEIQMLADEDRGYELEGLIGRLKTAYPDSQLICLSATVGNPGQIASRLGLTLVQSPGRPVPLERYVVLALSENDKWRLISKFIKNENIYVSTQGYRGQTIVFTNSRRKTEELVDYLSKLNIKAVAYHAGMTYSRRKKIEEAYIEGVYQAIITTFALGAGFDAPCSQVIFESLMMGNDYLTVTMFNQMLGRAGRLGRHDRGKVVLIIELGRKALGTQNQTEDDIAIQLLEGSIEPVEVYTDFDREVEQILALISVYNELEENNLKHILKIMPSVTDNLNAILSYLRKYGFIEMDNGRLRVTSLGKNVSISFLKIGDAKYITENIGRKDFLDIAINMEPFEAAYLSNRVVAELANMFHTFFPTRFFSGSLLGSIGPGNVKLHKRMPGWMTDLFSRWMKDIFNCKCKENPFCDCGKINLSKKLLELRMMGLTPRNISNYLIEEYDIYAYPGDIFDWLETFLHNLTAVKRISEVKGMLSLSEEIAATVSRIQTPL